MATKPTSPMDATGRAAEDAAKRNAKELADRKDEMSLARAVEEELLQTGVFDPKTSDKPVLIDEIEEVGVSINNEHVIIRTISDIENMTYGVVNGTPQSYTFKSGVQYKVPKDLAVYLQNIGYLWLN